MRFLYLVFAVFLLVSLAAPGYGKFRKTCGPLGYCSQKCRVVDFKSSAGDCKYTCCIPPRWKGK